MTLTAMPAGWDLESGTLGTDIDEDTTTFRTGGRSLKLLATGNLVRILSKQYAVSDGGVGPSSVSEQRRILGVTGLFYISGALGGTDLKVIVYWYDSTGAYVGVSTKNVYRGAASIGFWHTSGMFSPPVANARFARVGVEFQNATNYVLFNGLVPYFMPPFAHASKQAGALATSVGTQVKIPLQLNPSGTSQSAGCHGYKDDTGAYPAVPAGAIEVSEAGVYNVSAMVELDDYTAAHDVLQLKFLTGANSWYGPMLTPTVSRGSLAAAPAYDLHIHWPIPMAPTEPLSLWIYHWAGTTVNVVDAQLQIGKDN